MTFLAKPLLLDRDQMVQYILSIPKDGFKPNPNTGVVWNPKGVTLHNAWRPNLSQWESYSEAQKEAWGHNYDLFVKTVDGWHSGPHAAATPEPWSFILADLQADGVHSSCVNHDHFGVEMVGDFAVGADDPTSGLGLRVLEQAANIVAALNIRFGFAADALDFHRNCAHDHHDCPGAQVTPSLIINLIKGRMLEIGGHISVSVGGAGANLPSGAPVPLPPVSEDPVPIPISAAPPVPKAPEPKPELDMAFYTRAARVYKKWLSLGVPVPFAVGMLTAAEADSHIMPFNRDLKDNTIVGWGLYSWPADRAKVIKNRMGVDVSSEQSLERQCEAAWWELTAIETQTRDLILKATHAADAATLIAGLYDGVTDLGETARRQEMANLWTVWLTNNHDFLNSVPSQ